MTSSTAPTTNQGKSTHTMKHIGFAGILAAALSAAVIGIAGPAGAAETTQTADDVVASLQDQGYHVHINNPDNIPLDQAQVSDIRRGNTITEWTRDNPRDRMIKKELYTNVYVDVK
ncbi:hypothetical protein [Mycolicibacterium palauense]|uniref:hypothetical protein n=1 Tax=Mycolicibacterium palauense TaxID=2034511 RepID=UPI000BFF0583|nr:hypothetical protein [Mycolicibacterium palauense]